MSMTSDGPIRSRKRNQDPVSAAGAITRTINRPEATQSSDLTAGSWRMGCWWRKQNLSREQAEEDEAGRREALELASVAAELQSVEEKLAQLTPYCEERRQRDPAELRDQRWNGKGEMESRGHDDMVIAYGIALAVRDQSWTRGLLRPEPAMPKTDSERYWAAYDRRLSSPKPRRRLFNGN